MLTKIKSALAICSLMGAGFVASACTPSPAGYQCRPVERTAWLSELPDHTRFASMTVGFNLCTQDNARIVSAIPYTRMNAMGYLSSTLLRTGSDGVRTDFQNNDSVQVTATAYSQMCVVKYLPICSFKDHVHLRLAYTLPVHIGPNGTWYWTDRGDIGVWWTP